MVVSPDDRALSRISPEASQPSLVSSDDGFELGTLGMNGIVLAFGAGAALIAVHEARTGRRLRRAIHDHRGEPRKGLAA